MGANRRHRPGLGPVVGAKWGNPTGRQPLRPFPAAGRPSQPEKALGQLAQASHALEPLHLLAANGAALITGGAMVYAGYVVAAADCLDPTPFEPLTCAAALAVGLPLTGAGFGLTGAAAYGFARFTLPTMREDWGLP